MPPSMAWPVTTTTALPDVGNENLSSSSPVASNHDPSLGLPRIIFLHGGGTNARIFRTQCRVIRTHLSPFFRLVFVDAPFFSQPGPDVELVYAKWGPFRSWMRPQPDSSGFKLLDANESVVESINQSIATAMEVDNKLGATGRWIGLLGFSQGAKIAASLLLRHQNQSGNDQAERLNGGREIDYRFAVLLAGRGPLVSMGPDIGKSLVRRLKEPDLLRLPTIHVHGLRDAGISMHRNMINESCEKGSTRLIEWDGDHRVPIKTKDVMIIVTEILAIARKGGVLIE